MWGEEDIDDVLEKLKFEDALKEVRQNQEKLLQNQSNRGPKVVNRCE